MTIKMLERVEELLALMEFDIKQNNKKYDKYEWNNYKHVADCWIIINDTRINELKNLNNPTINHGYVYAIEIGDYLKIGSTVSPYYRIKDLIHYAQHYADVKRIACSKEHINFRDNEKILHKYFNKYRKIKTELFKMTLDELIKEYSSLNYGKSNYQ